MNLFNTHLVAASDPRIRWVGRSETHESAVRFAWSGSGFVVRFNGTGLTCVLRDHANFFTVSVNGALSTPRFHSLGAAEQPLVANLPYGEHTVAVLRRTEPCFGESELSAVGVIDGELLPPVSSPPLIELVGDSISCGYGNESSHPSDPFIPDTENHHRSFGAILARRLGCELSTIAWRGRGVVRNYADEPEPLIPQLYLHALPNLASPPWAFHERVSLVIVNLGTNDFTTPGPDLESFVAGYANLLATIRARRPHAPILCTIGPMLAPLTRNRARSAIERAVRQHHHGGDTNVTYYPMQTPNRNPVANEHPSVATHEAMAEELYDVARRLLETNVHSQPSHSE
jgi:lysophospholipase L1-like esterase